MKRLFLAATLLALSLVPALAAMPKVFIASTGVDSNDGGRLTPKRSLQAAHDAVDAGGAIVILDTAGYGAVTIGKSVTITVPPGVNGISTVAGSAIAVYINAADTDIIALRGLLLEGGGSGSGGTGVFVGRAKLVVVEDCIIRNFSVGVSSNTRTSSHVIVRGGAIRDVSTGIGLNANFENSALEATVTDLLIDNASGAGLYASASSGMGTGTAKIVATRCVIASGNVAVQTMTPQSTIIVDACTIHRNNFAFYRDGGTGVILSRGNNTITSYTTFINSGMLGTQPSQ